jgi:hypothetical protein
MVRLVEETARNERLIAATLIASGRYDAELVTVSQRRREFDELLLADPAEMPAESDDVRLFRILGVA